MKTRAGLATFTTCAAFAGGGVVINVPGDLGKVAKGFFERTRLHGESSLVETPEAGFGDGFAKATLVERFGGLFDDPTIGFAFLEPSDDLVTLVLSEGLESFQWW